jgi:hypothetical protein
LFSGRCDGSVQHHIVWALFSGRCDGSVQHHIRVINQPLSKPK